MSDIVIARQVTSYEVDWLALADAVERQVMAKLAADLEKWTDDRAMRSMFLGDASDGLDVCEVIAEGKWRAVEERLWKMDTAAREYVYDFIERAAGVDFHELTQNMT